MGNTADGPRTGIGKTLTEENVAELSALSGFTPEQVREWHASFLKDCPTGKLKKNKISDIYKQFLPSGKADKYCEHLFRAFDTDNSGDLDFGEFLIAISITVQQEPKKRLEWAFLMCDINRNGYIEKKEMTKILDALFEMLDEQGKDRNSTKSKVDEIFLKIDTNHDGKLSKEEFITGCLRDDYLLRLFAPGAS